MSIQRKIAIIYKQEGLEGVIRRAISKVKKKHIK